MKTTLEETSKAFASATPDPARGADEVSAREQKSAVKHMTSSVLTLGTSVGLQSALGFIFVVTAARMFGASVSGADLTIIAVARGLAAVVQLNMAVVVHRLLPTVQKPARFVLRTYLITTSLAVAAALAVVFVAGQHSEVVHELVQQPFYAAFFVVAVAAWNIFALQDIVLATLRRARIVVIESAVYGVAAIGGLFITRAMGFERPILLAFFAPVLPLACVVSWFVFRHAIPADLALTVRRHKLDVRRESGLIIGDFLMSTIELVVRAVTPVLVADWLGTDIAAGYAVASAIAFAMGDLFTSIQRSLAQELSRHPEQRSSLLRRAMRMIGVGVVPSALALAALAPLVLRIFGKDFLEAAPYLRLLALSAIPACLGATALTVARAQRATKATVGTLMVVHTLTIVIILSFLRSRGLVAIGFAYLVGWTAGLVPSWLYLLRHRGEPALGGSEAAQSEAGLAQSEAGLAQSEAGLAQSETADDVALAKIQAVLAKTEADLSTLVDSERPRRSFRLNKRGAALCLLGCGFAAAAPFLPQTQLRTAAVLATMLVLPGLPFERWLRFRSATAPIVAVALSLSLWTVLSLLGAEFGVWNSVALYETVIALSAVALLIESLGSPDRTTADFSALKLDLHGGLIVLDAVVLVAFATWDLVRHLDPEAYDSYGLLHAAPRSYFAALLVILGASVYNLWREKFSEVYAAILVGLMLFLFHGVLPLVYGTPRFGWSPKYIGVIEYVLDNHSFDRKIDAFHNWPGFFAVAGTFSDLIDFRPLSYAPWAPLFFNLLLVGALDFLYRSFSSNARQRWLAIMLVVLANWVGQDYLAPQAFVLVLAFILIGLVARVLSAFPQRTAVGSKLTRMLTRIARTNDIRPDLPYYERSSTTKTARNRGLVACIVVFTAIVVSHQLTPLAVVLVTFVFALFRRLIRRDLLLLMMIILVAWMISAHAYLSTNTYLLQLPNPFANATTTPFSQISSNPEAGIFLAYRAGIASAAVIAVLALVGLFRRIRSGFSDVEAVLICVAPVVIGVAVRYGAEAPLRAYLYALPGLCFLASCAFMPRRSSWRTWRGGAACLIVVVGLGFGFIVAAYGRESVNYIRSDELAVGRVLGADAPPGSFVVTVAPGQDAKVTRGYAGIAAGVDGIGNLFDVPGRPLANDNIDENTVAALVSSLSDRMGSRSLYIVAGPSQRAYIHQYRLLTDESYDRLIDLLRANPNIATVADQGGAYVFAIVKPETIPVAQASEPPGL